MNSSIASRLNNFMRWFFIVALFCCFVPTKVALVNAEEKVLFRAFPSSVYVEESTSFHAEFQTSDPSHLSGQTILFTASDGAIEESKPCETSLGLCEVKFTFNAAGDYTMTIQGTTPSSTRSVNKTFKVTNKSTNYQIKELTIDPNPVVGGQKVSCTAKLTNNGTPVEGETIKFTIQEGRDPQQEETCPSNRNGECTIEYTTSSTTENKDLFVEASYEGKASEMKVITITPTPTPTPTAIIIPPIDIPNPLTSNTFEELIANFLKWILSIIGGIALLMLIVAGVLYITSVGDEKQAGQAKKIITWTLIGLIIILSSWSIIKVLEDILIK